jgi:FtsP/CotA-like multicopper oxidase with cupredoxin domain
MRFGGQRVRIWCALLAAVAGVVALHAQPTVGAPVPIVPTVTKAMGDVGGKIFGREPEAARTRHYFVAAESEMWAYAPSGRDELCGAPLPPPVVQEPRVGKLRYVQYTDATFGTRVMANSGLGILGPVLRGVVGDYIAVTFLNRTDQPLSIHPHGVRYDPDNEGSYHRRPGKGAAIGPGATFTYVWQLDASSGPLPDEPSSKAWLYHSHVSGDTETNLGLVGALIVTDPKRARPDATPADVDREFASLFMIFNESGLDEAAIEAAEYAGLGLASATPPPSWAQIQQQIEQGSRYAINGRIFGNLPSYEMNEGERTRWYLFGLGSEKDFHTAHWHGLRVVEEGRRRTDTVELMPASMKVVDLAADQPGEWLFHCHVAEHMREGMYTGLVVHARDTVGVDRSPARSFLGLPAAQTSLRLTRAEVNGNEVRLAGAMTVFEAFSIFSQPLTLRIGDRTVTWRIPSRGHAQAPEGAFEVKNANDVGVIAGGVLQFEATLQGAEWVTAARKQAAEVRIEVGAAKHRAGFDVKP